jgi:HAD superfamily hydrolase (TIGR01509 family)
MAQRIAQERRKSGKMPALVIFDCDGVLIDSEVIACEAVAAVLQEFGYDLGAEAVSARFAGYQDSKIAEELVAEGGPSLPRDFAARCAAQAMAEFPGRLTALTGVRDLLQTLTVPFCVASNSGRERLRCGLEVAGLLSFFPDHIRFSAQDVARPKPAPDLHLLAAKSMGAAPADSLVIEDSPGGVTAAKAAGMRVIGFCGAAHLEPGHEKTLSVHGADACVLSFSDLATHLLG